MITYLHVEGWVIIYKKQGLLIFSFWLIYHPVTSQLHGQSDNRLFGNTYTAERVMCYTCNESVE